MKIIFIRSYSESEGYKNFRKWHPIYGSYLEVEEKIKEIEKKQKNKKMLYVTNGYLQVIVNNDLDETLLKETLHGKFITKDGEDDKGGLKEISEVLKNNGLKVFEYFDEMTFDFDSNFSEYDGIENIIKLSFNYNFKIFKEILEHYDFLYIKKIFITKYNDFLDYGNFQITLGYDNIVNGNFQIHKLYEKIMKLNGISIIDKNIKKHLTKEELEKIDKKTLLFDNALKSKSQLKIKKIGGRLNRKFEEYNKNKRTIKVIELNFQTMKLETILEIIKKNNLNIKKDIIEQLYSISKNNISNIINLKTKKKENIKKYFSNKRGNQIELNKKIFLLDNLYNIIVDKEYKKVEEILSKKRSEYNNIISNILEEIGRKVNLTEEDRKDLKNKKEIINANLNILTQRVNYFSSKKIKEYGIEKEIELINKIHYDYIDFYKKQLNKFKQVKILIKNDILKSFHNKDYKKLKELFKKYMGDIPKSTFYYLFNKKENSKLLFTNKQLNYQTIKDKYFLNFLKTTLTEHGKKNYLTNNDIETFIEQIKLDFEKELSIKNKKNKNNRKIKGSNISFDFFSEDIIYRSYKNKLDEKLERLEKKLLKKKKLTAEKFFNIITKEIDIFEELYKIKGIIHKNFQVSYGTIKNLSKKYFFYFKDKFNTRKQYEIRGQELEQMRKEYKENGIKIREENSERIVNYIKTHLKENANVEFYEGNRWRCMVYTVGYIKYFIEKLELEDNNDAVEELNDILGNLGTILGSGYEEFLIESHINEQNLIWSV